MYKMRAAATSAAMITVLLMSWLQLTFFLQPAKADSATTVSPMVFWTLEPSSVTLQIFPGKEADLVVTLRNDKSSNAPLQWSSMSFGGYYDDKMQFIFKYPPKLAPDASWTGSIGTVCVYPDTPYETLCTCPFCNLEIHVVGGVPQTRSIEVTVIAATPLPIDAEIHPGSLNLRNARQGWITAYLSAPSGYSADDILLETVRLKVGDTCFPVARYAASSDGYITVKFSRTDVVNHLRSFFHGCERVPVEFRIIGTTVDDIPFEGTDVIQLI